MVALQVYRKMTLTGEQIRAARAILRMEQATLAAKARVSVETIKRLEKFDGPLEPRAQLATLLSIRRAFELAGLDLEAGGVRWKAERHALMIDALTTNIERLIRANLEEAVRRDPEFFDRGLQHVRDKLVGLVTPFLLGKMIEQIMPDEGAAAGAGGAPTKHRQGKLRKSPKRGPSRLE